MDIHKGAMFLSLLERGVAPELAGLVATAVHPFADGQWLSDRKSEKAARRISTGVARAIGRGRPDPEQLKSAAKTAFQQYSGLAPAGSEAAEAWTALANREALQ